MHIFILKSSMVLICLILSFKTYSQEWTDMRIIYVENNTAESSNPLTVIIEFKYAKCLEINLGKKEIIPNGKSYYRFTSSLTQRDCSIAAKFDYIDCSGKTNTVSFSKNIDDWINLNANNSFDGIKLLKIYDIVVSGCKDNPEKDKPAKPTINNDQKNTVNPETGNTGSNKGFFFFGTIKVPIDHGIFDIYTYPYYYEGNVQDDDKLRKEILAFNEDKVHEILKGESEKMLERKLRPQGKIASFEDIEKQTKQLLTQIKESPQEYIYIWTKTPDINYLAKTESKSKEQMQEVISTMKSTLYGLCGDDTYPNCYRYTILNKEDNTGSGNQLSGIKDDDGDNKKDKDEISDGQTKKIFDLFFGQGSSADFSINDEDTRVAKSLLTELINRSCQMAVVEGLQSLDISLMSIAESIYTITSNCNNAKNKGKYYEAIRNTISVKWKSAFSVRKQTGEW